MLLGMLATYRRAISLAGAWAWQAFSASAPFLSSTGCACGMSNISGILAHTGGNLPRCPMPITMSNDYTETGSLYSSARAPPPAKTLASATLISHSGSSMAKTGYLPCVCELCG